MIQIWKCALTLLILIGAFEMCGWLFGMVLKQKLTKKEQLLYGFFVYFSLFQIVALPCVLLKVRLHCLAIIWTGVLIAMLLMTVSLWLYRRKRPKQSMEHVKKEKIRPCTCLLAIVVGILLISQCYFVAVQRYVGWDTAYYIGTINDALYTDTMYQYDGNSGWMLSKINLRYALSMFYMNTAVFCKLFGIEALLVQKYVMGTLCVLLASTLIYLIGKELWHNTEKALIFTGFSLVLHYIFQTLYTNSQFLLYRAYEAKAFCANVVIIAVLYCILQIWRDIGNKKNWTKLFLVAFASVPVSMSSILIVPAMIGIFFLGRLLLYREWRIVAPTAMCILPNAVYLVVYFLYTRGWIVIGV